MIKMTTPTTTTIQFSELTEILDNSVALRLEPAGMLLHIEKYNGYVFYNKDDDIDIVESNIEQIFITTTSKDDDELYIFSVTILLKNPNHNHLTGSKEVSFIPLVKMKKR